MNMRVMRVVLLFALAVIFFGIGVQGEPRNSTYIALGVVFLVLALARLRRDRGPGNPPGPS